MPEAATALATPAAPAAPHSTTTATAPIAPAAPTNGTPWYEGFQDQGVKDWLKAYGDAYPNPEAVALKALNLEKFVGADAAKRGAIIPREDAKPEEVTAFYRKHLGAPEKPEGYKLPDALAKDPLAEKFRAEAHAMGMPSRFFEGAVGWFQKAIEETQQGEIAKLEVVAEQEMTGLKAEWGKEWDRNVELGRRAAKQFIPHAKPEELQAILTSMEGALGTGMTMKLWAAIGRGLGEHGFVMGEGGGGVGGMSPEAARLRIGELKKDSGFYAKMASGDMAAKEEWDRLHRIGYAEK